jgi:TonB family protein
MDYSSEGKMDGRGNVDVSDWADSQRPTVLPSNRTQIAWGSTFIGLVLTLLVHGTAMTILAYGSVDQGAAVPASSIRISNRKPNLHEALTLLELPISQQAFVKPVMAFAIDLAPVPAIEAEAPKLVSVDIDEPTATEWLHSIYIRQIQARIERVWRRPRTPVKKIGVLGRLRYKDEPFECELLITQDARGDVEDVELQRCNGSAAWQQSLIDAIRGASPLPAPPNASTFSASIGLTFVARPYAPGTAEDDYEPPPRQYVSAE